MVEQPKKNFRNCSSEIPYAVDIPVLGKRAARQKFVLVPIILKDVDMATSVDDLKTSRSLLVTPMPELRDAWRENRYFCKEDHPKSEHQKESTPGGAEVPTG